MAAFSAQASYTQDSSGSPVTFLDQSSYSSNTENYTTANFIRSFLIYDAANALIATLPLTGSNLSVSMAVTKDQYLKAVLQLTGINPTPNYSKTINIGLERFTDNAFNTLLLYGCGCEVSPAIVQSRNKALAYMYGAQKALIYGNGAGYDRYISAAYANLTYANGIS